MPDIPTAETLPSLSAESRAALSHHFGAVQRVSEHSYNKNRIKTSKKRLEQYQQFCHTFLIGNACLLFVSHFWEANRIFAMYALDLALGYTIKCITIKSKTISEYLKVAADFVEHARRRSLIGTRLDQINWYDPRIDLTTGKTSSDISAIISEVKRWESMPNRREPLTADMVRWLATQTSSDAPHSYKAALHDWFTVGLYVGPRLTEWAQDNSGKTTLTRAQEAKAFLLKDLTFFQENCRRVTLNEALARPHLVHTINITFREQKNGDNGAQRTIVRMFGNASLCAVSAMLRIVQRWMDLNLDPSRPLSVFTNTGRADGKVLDIRARHIERVLQDAAKAVYNITDPKDLGHFTSHSLCVGACVALHSAGIDPMSIKHALRWRSDAFMEYLRNLPLQAQRNSRAVTDFDPMRLDIIPH